MPLASQLVDELLDKSEEQIATALAGVIMEIYRDRYDVPTQAVIEDMYKLANTIALVFQNKLRDIYKHNETLHKDRKHRR